MSDCKVVSLYDLMYTVIQLKLRALRSGDTELYDVADELESSLKLLMDKSTIFER